MLKAVLAIALVLLFSGLSFASGIPDCKFLGHYMTLTPWFKQDLEKRFKEDVSFCMKEDNTNSIGFCMVYELGIRQLFNPDLEVAYVLVQLPLAPVNVFCE